MTDTTIAPVTPQDPTPPRTHRLRNGLVVTAVVFASLGVLGALAGQHTAAPAAPKHTSAPAAPAAKADPMTAWCAGPGYAGWQDTQDDLGAMSDDITNEDFPALTADSSSMAGDALAAQGTPPPLGSTARAAYSQGLSWLTTAGREVAAGDITDAGSALQTATVYIKIVSPDVNAACG